MLRRDGQLYHARPWVPLIQLYSAAVLFTNVRLT